MSEQHSSNQLPTPTETPNSKKTNLVDEAFGQGIITVNEYRQLLGLTTFSGGNVTLKKKSLEEYWKV